MKISDAFKQRPRFDRGPWVPSGRATSFQMAESERIAWDMERYDKSYGSPSEMLRRRNGPYTCLSCHQELAAWHVCPNDAVPLFPFSDAAARNDVADAEFEKWHDDPPHWTSGLIP